MLAPFYSFNKLNIARAWQHESTLTQVFRSVPCQICMSKHSISPHLYDVRRTRAQPGEAKRTEAPSLAKSKLRKTIKYRIDLFCVSVI